MATDWYSATIEERKILYRAAKQLVDRHSLTWNELFERAFGAAFHRGKGYESNFGNGKIARYRAAIIHRWLRSEHPDLADIVEREIMDLYQSPDTLGLWERLIAEHGVFGAVQAVREERRPPESDSETDAPRQGVQMQPQITRDHLQLARDVQNSRVIDMNHPFRFRLTCPIPGAVLGFQWVRGRWWSFPLGAETIEATVHEGEQDLPPRRGVSLDGGALIEGVEAGLHRVAFVILPGKLASNAVTRYTLADHIHPPILDDLAKTILAMPQEAWRVLRLNLMFVTSDASGGVM